MPSLLCSTVYALCTLLVLLAPGDSRFFSHGALVQLTLECVHVAALTDLMQ